MPMNIRCNVLQRHKKEGKLLIKKIYRIYINVEINKKKISYFLLLYFFTLIFAI